MKIKQSSTPFYDTHKNQKSIFESTTHFLLSFDLPQIHTICMKIITSPCWPSISKSKRKPWTYLLFSFARIPTRTIHELLPIITSLFEFLYLVLYSLVPKLTFHKSLMYMYMLACMCTSHAHFEISISLTKLAPKFFWRTYTLVSLWKARVM